MKITFILLSTLFLPALLWAQKIHFTDSTNVWRVLDVNNGPPTTDIVSYYGYVGDTLIDSTAYRIMFCGEWSGYSSSTTSAFCLVREDTLLKKVFALINDTEQVLMDYNLNVGDSLVHKDCYGDIFLNIVTSIDSVMINSREYRIWSFNTSYLNGISALSTTNYSVVEGIGCLNGPLFMNAPFWGFDELGLTCFYNDGSTPSVSPSLYTGAFFYFDNQNSCTLDVNIITPHSIKIFPDPVTSTLTITYSDKITQLSIFNTIGQTVFARNYNSDQVQVDVDNLPPGIYFIKINETEIRKFVKE